MLADTRFNYGRDTFTQVNSYGRLVQDMLVKILTSEGYSLIQDISEGVGYNTQKLPDQFWKSDSGENIFIEVKAHTTDSEWNGKSQVGVNENQYNRYLKLEYPVYYAVYLRWKHMIYIFQQNWIKDNYSHSTRKNDVYNKIPNNRHNFMYYVSDLESPQIMVERYNLEKYRKIIGKDLWKKILTG